MAEAVQCGLEMIAVHLKVVVGVLCRGEGIAVASMLALGTMQIWWVIMLSFTT